MAMSEDEITRALYSACSDGDHFKLCNLLDNYPYALKLLDLTNRHEPPKALVEKTIYTSCLKGHYKVTKELLRSNVNPNAMCEFGSPIYAAVSAGNIEIIKLLIDFKADYKRVRGGFSPLFVACVEGNLKVLKFLVNVGADLYFFTNPPLVFTACMQGHLDVLKYLMEEMEYDIHRTINGEDAIRMDGKDSLLYVACSSRQVEIADFLLTKGAIITHTIILKFPAIVSQLLERRVKMSNRPAEKGMPPSFTARWKELGLAELPWNFVSGSSHTITKLELHSNRLTSLPDKIFQMANLRILDISQNLLSEITAEEVDWKCTNLTEFNATKNQIAYVPSGLFTCTRLNTLNLSYNLLQRLPGDPEDACPNVVWRCDLLKKLDLSHNRLRALPDCFKSLKRLNTLVVSYNYLNELPSSCALGCINLVHLDAAHNSLKELPLCASNYWMHCLERLYLSHNEFDEISRNITELAHLTTLDLSHNRISCLPPTNAWTNTKMNRISLAHNNLTSLTQKLEDDQTYTKSGTSRHNAPSERRRATTAWNTMRLFGGRNRRNEEPQATTQATDNTPRELPVDKWSVSLQSLYLQNNQIRFLPDYIGQLIGLSRLDVSNNTSIHCIPLTYGRLKNCWELIMNGLDITNVPKHLLPGIGRGASTKQLIAYLKGQLKNSRPYNRMKLMAVGLQGRGKTTLLSVLRDSSAALPPNVSTVGVNVHEWVIHPPKQRGLSQRQQLDVVFSTWDLAGQEVYYATHQCFLSRNTLYLLVWNMAEGEKGVEYLRPWLLNIQARAPYSPVIIVGTHLDKIQPNKIPELKKMYASLITKQYDNDGYPTISDICMVSSVTRDGIKDLQERIHAAALNAKDPDTHEHVIGMQVPSSYIELQKLVECEAKRYREMEKPPVLNQKEFAVLAAGTGDVTDPEELSLAANFLHDNGVLLHYNDHLKGLNNLYFIDPVWLADMLAHIITVPQKHSFVQNGILREVHLKFIFRGNRLYPENFLAQYMQLLERFEIALSLGQGALLIPSMLPEQRPALPFANPLPRPRHNTSNEPSHIRKSTIKQGSDPSAQKLTDEVPAVSSVTKIVNGQEVVNTNVTCVRRRLRMAYIPSGFWSRLISRLIINLKRSGLTDNKGQNILADQNIAYWRRGLLASHQTGKFLVESVQSTSTEMSGVAISNNMMQQSVKFVGDALDAKANIIQGVDITVWSDAGDFSAMGYVVDQLDSLIDEWFPGLNDLDIEGEWLIERQALWVVPPELKKVLKPPLTEEAEEFGEIPGFIDPVDQDVFIFKLEDCALKALISDNILCAEYNVFVPLSHIVPDLLLTDLPKDFIIDTSQLDFNPKDPSTRLGRGGAGAVYRGKYRNENVAIKEFLTQAQVESGYDEYDDMGGAPPIPQVQQDESITSAEALFLFRDIRQEVTVLAQLSHPNIVSLLGVSLRPMCICLELAPMGSLFGILDKKLETIKQAQADLPSAIIRIPGGILGHEISARISLQVALALRYLHKQGIVYRDLKSDNVLIWSLDVDSGVNAKLADYGISRFANPGGIKGEEGTPGYMAPEAIKRRGEDQAFDEKVDVFAFGMLLFELLTGQRPFENLTSGQEVNRAVIERERPQIEDGNCEPCFPAMVELMQDCWRHLASERPTANEVVSRIISPGFLSCRHCLTRVKDHPLQKLDVVYAQPSSSSDDADPRHNTLWLWSQQDTERKYSTMDVKRGCFMFPDRPCPGGRVYAMASTGEVEKRVWVATSVSKNYPDFEIQVFGYKPDGEPQCLWSFIAKDSVLDLATEIRGGRVHRVFASLANGTICIFYRKSIAPNLPSVFGDAVLSSDACQLKCNNNDFFVEAKDWENPYILTLSEGIRASAVKYMTFVGKEHMWCACGNTISVVDVVNLKVLSNFNVFKRRNQLVNELVSNGTRVWGIGRQLSCVMEWDAKTQELLTIFDCNRVDPTGCCLKGDPSSVEELAGTCRKEEDITPSESPITDRDDELANDSGSLSTSASPKDDSFQVLNEPQNPSKMVNAACNSRITSRSLTKTVKRAPRDRSMVITHEMGKGIFGPRPEMDAQQRARIRSHLRMQGATRTTSLLYMQDVLWIARGMGDVLIVDVSGTNSHGVVLARFASEDSHKYGNKSTHKLTQVGSQYVVSSQWLEPLEMGRPAEKGQRSQTITETSSFSVNPSMATSISSEPLTAHQQITVWEGWNQERVQLYNKKISHMLQLDEQDSEE